MRKGTWIGIAALALAACAAPGVPPGGREVRGLLLEGSLGPGLRAEDLRLVADRVEWERRGLEGCVQVLLRLGVGPAPPPHVPAGTLPLGLYAPTYRAGRDGRWESRVSTPDGSLTVRTSAWLGGFDGSAIFFLYDVPRDATVIESLPVELSVRRQLRSADERVVLAGPGEEAHLGNVGITLDEDGLSLWFWAESERASLFFPDFRSEDSWDLRDGKGRRLTEGPGWGLGAISQQDYGSGGLPITVTRLRPTWWEAGLVRFELRDLPIPPPPAPRR